MLTASDQSDTSLSDEAREIAIAAHGKAMQEAYDRWDKYGCFDDHAQAQVHLDRQNALIRGRSAAQVARMEAAKGLPSA